MAGYARSGSWTGCWPGHGELDILFERLYEDNVSGKIDDARKGVALSYAPAGTVKNYAQISLQTLAG